jgi:hypothetical protein
MERSAVDMKRSAQLLARRRDLLAQSAALRADIGANAADFADHLRPVEQSIATARAVTRSPLFWVLAAVVVVRIGPRSLLGWSGRLVSAVAIVRRLAAVLGR